MSLTQKFVALGTILFIVLALFLFSPLLGIVGLFASAPLAVAIFNL